MSSFVSTYRGQAAASPGVAKRGCSKTERAKTCIKQGFAAAYKGLGGGSAEEARAAGGKLASGSTRWDAWGCVDPEVVDLRLLSSRAGGPAAPADGLGKPSYFERMNQKSSGESDLRRGESMKHVYT